MTSLQTATFKVVTNSLSRYHTPVIADDAGRNPEVRPCVGDNLSHANGKTLNDAVVAVLVFASQNVETVFGGLLIHSRERLNGVQNSVDVTGVGVCRGNLCVNVSSVESLEHISLFYFDDFFHFVCYFMPSLCFGRCFISSGLKNILRI